MSDDHTLAALRERYGARYRWLLLMSVMVGTMASVMSSTIVNVAIPDMSQHFGLGQDRAQWIASGFMVAMTVSMLTTPWLLGRYGYRATYVGTMVLLGAGGVLGGVSNDYTLVLAARVAEGLAAGVVQPIPAIIIMRAFEPHEQGRAGSVFGTGVVLAPALGPSVGGLLVEGFGWRSIFFMVVPLCLLSVALARRYVPVTAPGGVKADASGPPLDWRGLLLAAGGTLTLLNGLVQWRGSLSATALGLLAAAVALWIGFALWQRRLHRAGGAPLMHPALFASRPFAMGSLVALTYGAVLFGSTYLLPVYMQMALQMAPGLVGTVLLPAGLALAATIALTGRLADRFEAYWLVSVGLGLLALSFALTVTVGLATPLVWLAALAALGRVGLGLVLASLNIGAMRGLAPPLIAQGASVVNFVRMLGGAAGVSLCGIVLQWRLAAQGDALAAHPAARLAAFNELFWMMAALCLLATLAAWRLRDKPQAGPPGPG